MRALCQNGFHPHEQRVRRWQTPVHVLLGWAGRSTGSSLFVPCMVAHLFLFITSDWFFPISSAEDTHCQGKLSCCIHRSGHWPPAAAACLLSLNHWYKQMEGCCVSISVPHRAAPFALDPHPPTQLLAGSELMSPHAAVPWAVTAGAKLTTGVFTLSAVEACLDLSPCHSVFVFSGYWSDVCCNILNFPQYYTV